MQDFPPYSGYGLAGGGGGGAPVNATYLVLSADGVLTDERIFTLAPRLSGVDSGAGLPYTVDLAVIGGLAPGSYTNTSLTVDAYGRITAAASGPAPVLSVSVDAGELTDTGTPTAPVLGLATTTVGAGSYTYASFTVDAFGRLTAASSGAAPVTSVSVDAGELTDTGTPTAPVLGLATTTVAAGSYTTADITVDAFGRITSAANGVPAAAAGWTDGGTVVYLTTSTDQVSIGAGATPTANYKVDLLNNAGVTPGGILVRGASSNNEQAFATRSPTSTQDNYIMSVTAIQTWGSGIATVDIRAYRNTANSYLWQAFPGANPTTFQFQGTVLTPSRRVATTTVTAAALAMTAALTTYDVIFCDPTANPQTITLPSAATAGNAGRRYTFKRIVTSANTVTINTAGGNIDGAASVVLAGGTLNAITVVSDGTNWWIV